MPATQTPDTPSIALIARILKVRAMPGFTGGTQSQIRANHRAFDRFLEAAADEKVPVASVYAAAGIPVRM